MDTETTVGRPAEWKPVVVWKVAMYILALHLAAAYTLVSVPLWGSLYTYLWGVFLVGVSAFGVTAGVHRLWTHRSYKAKAPLRVLLAICYSVAGQNTIYEWVRDHRVHHKFTETDADPHDVRRGFFFAHVGWQMTRRHPEVIRKGRTLDMSDIVADPVVQLHTKRLYAVENMALAATSLGEGWHNYHHVFPWDYRAAELGSYLLNMTTFYLDLFAKLGWAYDLKCPSQEMVRRVAQRYGDGSHPRWGHHHVQEVGEEEDPDMRLLHPSTGDGEDAGEQQPLKKNCKDGNDIEGFVIAKKGHATKEHEL